MTPIIKHITLALAALGLASVAVSCDTVSPEDGGALTGQSAQLNVVSGGTSALANPYRATAVTIQDPAVLTTEHTFTVNLLKPAEMDTKAALEASEEAAKEYQAINGTDFPILPSSMIEVPAFAEIAKGSTLSEPVTVKVTLDESIPMNTPYLFAVKLTSVEGGTISKPNNVALFTVTRYEAVPEVTKVLRMARTEFFTPAKQFSHAGSVFTMECLVNVEKFHNNSDDPGDAHISTLFGVEGGTLLRFGDASVPGNHLQAAGQEINFDFQPNVWYHIAFVSNNGDITVYINGNRVDNYPKSASLLPTDKPWLMGFSWSEGRGIQAQLAEVRVWKTARTQGQIVDNMFTVPATDEDLLAYWPMSMAEGDVIKDATGHGYDLTRKKQTYLQDPYPAELTILTLEEPVTIE